VFGKKKVGNKSQKVEIPTPLFSWGEIKKALDSFPYEIPLKRIKRAREAKANLKKAIKYLSGEDLLRLEKRVNEILAMERDAIKELRDYALEALAKIIIQKLLEEGGKQND